MKQKNKNQDFLFFLSSTLAAILSENMLVGKGINRAGYGSIDLQSNNGKEIIRAGYKSKLDF